MKFLTVVCLLEILGWEDSVCNCLPPYLYSYAVIVCAIVCPHTCTVMLSLCVQLFAPIPVQLCCHCVCNCLPPYLYSYAVIVCAIVCPHTCTVMLSLCVQLFAPIPVQLCCHCVCNCLPPYLYSYAVIVCAIVCPHTCTVMLSLCVQLFAPIPVQLCCHCVCNCLPPYLYSYAVIVCAIVCPHTCTVMLSLCVQLFAPIPVQLCCHYYVQVPEWREMTEQTEWRVKQPTQVACFWKDLKCWGAWDTTCGHKAKCITPSITWRRGMERRSTRWSSLKGWEKAIVSQTSIRTVFHRQCQGNLWERGWSACGLFQVHRYHLELNWTEQVQCYLPVLQQHSEFGYWMMEFVMSWRFKKNCRWK